MYHQINSIPTPWLEWKPQRGIPLLAEFVVSRLVGFVSFVSFSPDTRGIIDGANSSLAGFSSFVTNSLSVFNQSIAESANSVLAGFASFVVFTPLNQSFNDSAVSVLTGFASFVQFTPDNRGIVDDANSNLTGFTSFIV